MSNTAMFMQVLDTYSVTFELNTARDEEITTHTFTWSVSENDIEAFLRILRWNNISKFTVEKNDSF